MSQTPISEIREKYKKKKSVFKFFIILLAILLLSGGFLIWINYEYNLYLIYFIIFIVIPIHTIFSPRISEYDLIRYHLTELITHLEDMNFKKSEYHIDKLALSIKGIYMYLASNFLFKPTKSTLDNLLDLLKYEIYPCLKNKDCKPYIETLKQINKAFDYENLDYLNEKVDYFIEDRTERGNIHAIPFPHEQPHLLNRILESLTNYFRTLFDENIIVRAVFLIIVFSAIGYYISLNFSNITFDNSLFGPILILSGAIATKIGK